jgi:hypothetical protein
MIVGRSLGRRSGSSVRGRRRSSAPICVGRVGRRGKITHLQRPRRPHPSQPPSQPHWSLHLACGSTKPSKANAEAFEHAVAEIAHITRHLLEDLVTTAPPKSREDEAAKGRERFEKRMSREVAARTA